MEQIQASEVAAAPLPNPQCPEHLAGAEAPMEVGFPEKASVQAPDSVRAGHSAGARLFFSGA